MSTKQKEWGLSTNNNKENNKFVAVQPKTATGKKPGRPFFFFFFLAYQEKTKRCSTHVCINKHEKLIVYITAKCSAADDSYLQRVKETHLNNNNTGWGGGVTHLYKHVA